MRPCRRHTGPSQQPAEGNGVIMENVQTGISQARTSHPLLITAAIAVIVFCADGIAAIMGWIPKSGADTDIPTARSQAPAEPASTPTRRATNGAEKPHPLQV